MIASSNHHRQPTTIKILPKQIVSNIFRAVFQNLIYPLYFIYFVLFPIDISDYALDSSVFFPSLLLFLFASFVLSMQVELYKPPYFVELKLTNDALIPRYLCQKQFDKPIAYTDIRYVHIQVLYKRLSSSDNPSLYEKIKFYYHECLMTHPNNKALDFEKHSYSFTFHLHKDAATGKKQASWSLVTSALSDPKQLFQTLNEAGVLFTNKPLAESADNKINNTLEKWLGLSEDKHLNDPAQVHNRTDIGHRFLIVILVSLIGFVVSFYGYNHVSQAQHIKTGWSILSWIVCLLIAWYVCYPFVRAEQKSLPLWTTLVALPFATIFLHDAYLTTRWLIAEHTVSKPYAIAELAYVNNHYLYPRSVWQINALTVRDEKKILSPALMNKDIWLDNDSILPQTSKLPSALSVPIYCGFGDCFIRNKDLKHPH